MKLPLLLLFALACSSDVFSQNSPLLDSIPTTKEGFVKSESALINTINWLEDTPLNQQQEKRQLLNARVLTWLTNSPTVSVTLDDKVTPMSEKNPDLLLIFIGGWTKYALQHNYSTDAVQCSVAGLESVIKVYLMGNGVKKDKAIEKLVKLKAQNELESWVRTQLEKK